MVVNVKIPWGTGTVLNKTNCNFQKGRLSGDSELCRFVSYGRFQIGHQNFPTRQTLVNIYGQLYLSYSWSILIYRLCHFVPCAYNGDGVNGWLNIIVPNEKPDLALGFRRLWFFHLCTEQLYSILYSILYFIVYLIFRLIYISLFIIYSL